MTPAVKVRHPNHWTAREVLSFPSLFCPTLLLHRSPPVSLLSRSLSHPQPTLHTHAPQVCEWQSLTSPPHLVHPSVCLSNSPKWTLHTRKPAPRPSQPHPPPPTPVTLTSFLSVILALWDFSLHVHTCSLPLGVLSHLPCSPSRLFSPW